MSNDPYEQSLERKRAEMHGQVLTKSEWAVVRAALKIATSATRRLRLEGMGCGLLHDNCKAKEAAFAAVLARIKNR